MIYKVATGTSPSPVAPTTRRVTFHGPKDRRIEVRADGHLRGYLVQVPGGWAPDDKVMGDMRNPMGCDAIILAATEQLPAIVVNGLLDARAEVEARKADLLRRFRSASRKWLTEEAPA